MMICETFLSIQGEGVLTGRPTFFIRTSGCELDCSWCDTRYAKTEGKQMSLDELVELVKVHDVLDVCITGGEPMEQAELVPLCKRLLLMGHRVTVETNGSRDVTPLTKLGSDLLISMDVKCPSSGMQERNQLDNLERLRQMDQVKFTAVIDDLDFIMRVLGEHRTHAEKVIQPVWGTDVKHLARVFLKNNIDARLMLQIHKIIWDPSDKGV